MDGKHSARLGPRGQGPSDGHGDQTTRGFLWHDDGLDYSYAPQMGAALRTRAEALHRTPWHGRWRWGARPAIAVSVGAEAQPRQGKGQRRVWRITASMVTSFGGALVGGLGKLQQLLWGEASIESDCHTHTRPPSSPSSVHVSRALHLARTLQTAISALDQEATAHPAACPAPASAAAPIPRQSAQHGPQTIVRGYAIVEPPWSEADQPSCREQKPVCEC